MQQQEKGAKTPTPPPLYRFPNFEKNGLAFYRQKVLKSLGDCMMVLTHKV